MYIWLLKVRRNGHSSLGTARAFFIGWSPVPPSPAHQAFVIGISYGLKPASAYTVGLPSSCRSQHGHVEPLSRSRAHPAYQYCITLTCLHFTINCATTAFSRRPVLNRLAAPMPSLRPRDKIQSYIGSTSSICGITAPGFLGNLAANSGNGVFEGNLA